MMFSLNFSLGKSFYSNPGKVYPSIVLGIPVRYIHVHAGMAHFDDYYAVRRLLYNLVKPIDGEALAKLETYI